jgi:hypothetical protein
MPSYWRRASSHSSLATSAAEVAFLDRLRGGPQASSPTGLVTTLLEHLHAPPCDEQHILRVADTTAHAAACYLFMSHVWQSCVDAEGTAGSAGGSLHIG